MNWKECFRSANLIRSRDPDFRVLHDGSVYTARAVELPSEKRAFTIWLSDTQTETQKELTVVLEHRKKVFRIY